MLYKVVIPDSNFDSDTGALKNTTLSSFVTDTNDNQQDGDDNGIQIGGVSTQVESPVITLSAGNEPTATTTNAEDQEGSTQDDGVQDANGDMTVDFGFVAPLNGYTYPEALTGTGNDDYIIGFDGQDTLTGGAGADVFVYTKTSDGIDRITDFNPTQDKLDFRAIADNELNTATIPTGSNLFAENYVKAINFGSAGVMIQVDSDPTDDIFAKNVVLLKNDSGITANDIDASDFIF